MCYQETASVTCRRINLGFATETRGGPGDRPERDEGDRYNYRNDEKMDERMCRRKGAGRNNTGVDRKVFRRGQSCVKRGWSLRVSG